MNINTLHSKLKNVHNILKLSIISLVVSDKNLVLVSDPENVKDEFAFDNPGFKSAEGTNKGSEGGGWLKSQPPPTLSSDGLKQPQPMPRTFIDDTYLEVIYFFKLFELIKYNYNFKFLESTKRSGYCSVVVERFYRTWIRSGWKHERWNLRQQYS